MKIEMHPRMGLEELLATKTNLQEEIWKLKNKFQSPIFCEGAPESKTHEEKEIKEAISRLIEAMTVKDEEERLMIKEASHSQHSI